MIIKSDKLPPIFYFLQYLMDELRRGQRVRASLSNWYQEQVEPEYEMTSNNQSLQAADCTEAYHHTAGLENLPIMSTELKELH